MAYFNYKNRKIFYKELGTGEPLLLLHGNTASSKMFFELAPKYADTYKVILFDFLGCGQSERVEELEEDLWYDQAMQVICFLKEKGYRRVNLIGTSGGALTAINVALEAPELVEKLIADSFEGEQANEAVTSSLEQGRELSKQNAGARQFYEWMNGADWEQVVDADTKAVVSHAKNIVHFFHKPISELESEILFTGSKEDEFFPSGYYDKMFPALLSKIKKGQSYLFEQGGHPAMLSNEEKFLRMSKEFFSGELK